MKYFDFPRLEEESSDRLLPGHSILDPLAESEPLSHLFLTSFYADSDLLLYSEMTNLVSVCGRNVCSWGR